MSINANVQIIIQIHNFKNINLPHKALYSLEVQIYQNKKNQINSALPYNIIETKNKAKKNGISKNAYLEDNIFRTKYFPIDYQRSYQIK
jgi:flagellar motor switch protein FliM